MTTMISSRLPTFDDIDAEIRAARVALRALYQGPRVGDFIEFSDGRVGRFSYDWGDSIQWSEGGSWHLTERGTSSFSGALNAALPKAQLELVGERPGRFWFFHHDAWCAHNGVDCDAPCRVYRLRPVEISFDDLRPEAQRMFHLGQAGEWDVQATVRLSLPDDAKWAWELLVNLIVGVGDLCREGDTFTLRCFAHGVRPR